MIEIMLRLVGVMFQKELEADYGRFEIPPHLAQISEPKQLESDYGRIEIKKKKELMEKQKR